MVDEYIDIVNEKDEVIGKEKIDLAIAKNRLRRVAHIFVLNSAGDILIQLRSNNMAVSPGKYSSSAAGHASSGESYLQAAERETFEEIGIRPKLEFISKFRHKSPQSDTFVAFYIGRNEGPFTFDKNEIQYAMFMHMNDIKAMLKTKPNSFTETFRECFKLYLQHISKDIKD